MISRVCSADPAAATIGITGASHSACGACWWDYEDLKDSKRVRCGPSNADGAMALPIALVPTASLLSSVRLDTATSFSYGLRGCSVPPKSNALSSYENFPPPASMLSDLEHYNCLVTKEAEKYIVVQLVGDWSMLEYTGIESNYNPGTMSEEFGGTTVTSMVSLEGLDKSRCVVGGELGIPTNSQSALDLVKVDLRGNGCSPSVAACVIRVVSWMWPAGRRLLLFALPYGEEVLAITERVHESQEDFAASFLVTCFVIDTSRANISPGSTRDGRYDCPFSWRRQENEKPGVHQAGPSETKRTGQPWHRENIDAPLTLTQET
ncbi:hypothetical protein BDQ17DRAFT_1327082 [Cyathus striatus]|nr:hypothetical protein BDQ17DRAFT_1327082 [Cyathus striatus]